MIPLLQTIIPIPYYVGDLAPLTDSEARSMLGFLIVIYGIFIFTSLFVVVRYFIEKPYDSFWDWYFYGDYEFMGLFHLIMVCFCVLFIIIWLGSLIGDYL